MQDADIEPAGHGLRIVDSVVFTHLAIWETASVQGDAQILDAMCLRPSGREFEDSSGQVRDLATTLSAS